MCIFSMVWHMKDYMVGVNFLVLVFFVLTTIQLGQVTVFLFSQFSCSVVSDSLRPHGPQHARPPCPSPTPRFYPNSCPLSR